MERRMTKGEIMIGCENRCKDCRHLGHRYLRPGRHECWHHGGLVVGDNDRACPMFADKDLW